MDLTRWRGTTRILGSFAMVVAIAVPAGAVPREPPPQLHPGSWVGIGTARGTGAASVEGATFRMAVALDARFLVDVAGDAVHGTWEFDTPVSMTGTGLPGAGRMTWLGRVTGDGTVSGTAARLVLQADQHATGTVTVTADGRSYTQPVDNHEAMPPLDVTIVDATCVDAQGDWQVPLQTSATRTGWDASFDASWYALRELGAADDPAALIEALREDVDELLDRVNRTGEGADLLAPEDPASEPLPLEWEALVDMVDRTVELTNEVRNLGECARKELGPDGVERFFNALTRAMQNLVLLADEFLLEPGDIRMLMAAATNVGAVGAGATPPERAAGIEEVLRAQGERIANENVGTDGTPSTTGKACTLDAPCLVVSYDMVDVLVIGAQYGWSYTIADHTRSAEEWLAWMGDHPSRLPERDDS